MSISALEDFIDNQIRECKEKNMLLSLHLKASMMKVSDPIIFGHVLKVFFKNFIKNNNKVLDEINVDFNSGLSETKDQTIITDTSFKRIGITQYNIVKISNTRPLFSPLSEKLSMDNKIRPSPDEMAIALFVIIDQTAKNKPARSSPVS